MKTAKGYSRFDTCVVNINLGKKNIILTLYDKNIKCTIYMYGSLYHILIF